MSFFDPQILVAIFIATLNVPFFLSLALVIKAKLSSEEELELPKLKGFFIWWIVSLGLVAFIFYRLIDCSNWPTYPVSFIVFFLSLIFQWAYLIDLKNTTVDLKNSTFNEPKQDWPHKDKLYVFLRKPVVSLTASIYFLIAFAFCFSLIYKTESAYIEKMLKHESVEDGFVSKYVFVDEIYQLRSTGTFFLTPKYLDKKIVFKIPEDKTNPEANWALKKMNGGGGGIGRPQLLKIKYRENTEFVGQNILATVVLDQRREVVKASVY